MKKIGLLLFVFIALSCATEESINKNITLETSKKTLFKGEKFQLKAISDLDIIFESENEFHATVTEKGLVTAGFVGESNIIISNGEHTEFVNITIAPKNNLYSTPFLDFNASKSDVISVLGAPDEETESNIKYNNYSEASPSITYSFNEDDLLINVIVSIKKSYYATLTNSYLNERYRFANVFNNDAVGNVFEYHNSLNNTIPTLVVFLYKSSTTENYTLRYIPYSES